MINKRAEKELEAGTGEPGTAGSQDKTAAEQEDEWAALFEMDEEDDFEGSSDEMWKRDVLHM